VTRLDAWHLPGVDAAGVREWTERELVDGLTLRTPVPEPAALARVIDHIRTARERSLAHRPVQDIVAVIDEAAARLQRPDDPRRALAERALPALTGYSPPMIRLILDRMLADWRKDALETLLEAEFGDPLVLDRFRPGPAGGRIRAFGPELAFHIFAGNVPGVAVTSLVRSLLVKAATLGKTASGEPLLPALFARTLAEVDPELGACLAVTYWPGGSAAPEEVAFRAADTVVVYGGAAAADDVRRRVPADTRLVVHGPRLSFGVIGREALREAEVERTATAAAYAVATFDQQGCVSPHAMYVEEGGEVGPRAFAERLADALARVQEELPRGRISPEEAATIHQLRGAAEFRRIAGADIALHEGPGTLYTVIYDADPAFAPSCLNRVVWVKPLPELGDVVNAVRPFAALLQTAGVAGAGDRLLDLAERLGRIGVSRVTDLERMPWPPPTWHHDGRGPLRELVRWTDLDE